MEKTKKYFYVVECVKLKKENNHLVIDHGYEESIRLFDSLEKATDYYLKVTSYLSELEGCILTKVSAEETEETLNNYTFEFDDKVYYYVDELKRNF